LNIKYEYEKDIIIKNIENIKKWYEIELLTISEICNKLNVKFYNLKKIMIECNIKIRSHQENQLIVMNRNNVKENVSKASKKSQHKRKETNLKKYGVEVPASNLKWKDEYERKFGVRHPNQRKEAKKRMRGNNNPSKRIESKEKIKQNRWINKDKNELLNIRNKTIEKWKENLNVDNPLKSQKIIEKIQKTNISKRGVPWITMDEKVKEKILRTHQIKMKEIIHQRLKELNLELVNDFINVTDRIKLKCLKCNNVFDSVLDYVFHEYGLCPICYPRNISNVEKEIKEFIELFFDTEDLIYNDRKILNGKEIDIFIKSKNIAIECDGIYYHSEIHGITENYHLEKTESLLRKDIQLIHIFEDEWYQKNNIVKARLKRILNLDNSKKIFARKCQIKEINSNTKDEFLEKYHIQGKDISSIRLGAFYNNELVSVMTFSKGNISKGSKFEEGVWELNRFCSDFNYSVVGIAGKLLTYFKRNYKWYEIFSYADRRWSNGNTYYKLGFELDRITKPNYWYVKGLKRIHRFNLRKQKNEPVDIPEWKLRQNEGFYRIWDCGNLKFVMKNI